MAAVCEKTRLLLPLFRDNYSNEAETAEIVEHLRECEDCRMELRRIGGKFPRRHSSSDGTAPPAIKNKYMRYGIIAFVFLVLVILLIYGIRYRIWLDNRILR